MGETNKKIKSLQAVRFIAFIIIFLVHTDAINGSFGGVGVFNFFSTFRICYDICILGKGNELFNKRGNSIFHKQNKEAVSFAYSYNVGSTSINGT